MTATTSLHTEVTDTLSAPPPHYRRKGRRGKCLKAHLKLCLTQYSVPVLSYLAVHIWLADMTSRSASPARRPPKGKGTVLFSASRDRAWSELATRSAFEGKMPWIWKNTATSLQGSEESDDFKVRSEDPGQDDVCCPYISSASAFPDLPVLTRRASKWQPTTCPTYCRGHGDCDRWHVLLGGLMTVLGSRKNIWWSLN